MFARAIAVCLLALILLAQPAAGQTGGGTQEAVDYLMSRQNPDGGFSEPGASSDLRTTCWVLLAGSAAGEDPLSWAPAGADAGRFIESSMASTSSLEDIELAVLALASSGGDPRNVAGRDLVAVVEASASPDGRLGAGIIEHCWGMLALAAAGETVPAANTEWLVENQRTDGGWGESDAEIVEATALAVEALVAAEEDAAEQMDAALELLRGKIGPDGGFSGAAGASDAQATASVIRAINASGEDPASEDWQFEGNDPVSFLEALQAGDGHFQYSGGVESQPAMTTAMAVPALEGEYFPLLSALEADVTDEGEPGTTPADLGTAGAGAEPADGEGTTSANAGSRGAYRQASGALARSPGAGGFWVFLVACAVYALLLAALAAVIRLAAPKHRALAR